ncbi:MAG: glycosyl hydrolase [Candidatus Brocadiia bacterium]
MESEWLEEFRNPPAACGHVMFWIWNGEVNERRITEMLEQFAEQGVGGVFVHSRTGLLTEYLSDRWFELWEHSLRESARLGLECHIYDEDGFPSGNAGGRVFDECPDAAQQCLRVSRYDDPGSVPGTDLVAAWRLKPDGAPEPVQDGNTVSNVAGPVIAAHWHRPQPGERRRPDLSRPKVTQTFLRLTHDEYARRFGEQFGHLIRYVFTDEPGIGADRALPWSEYILAEFEQDHGYDLRERVGALLFETEDAPGVRFDYYETLNRLFCENFAGQCYDWCEEHDLQFTGHWWEHEWPSPGKQPNAMALYRWMQAPGVDMLGFQFDPSDRLKNSLYLLTLKEVSSVAAQLGRPRVLCETYGGGGYEMALEEFKPLSDWCMVHGVNVVNPHLSYQTLVGRRKYDWPQTISDHASWWPCYHLQAMHDRRTVFALLQGEERNRVLLLHPTGSAWLHYVPDIDGIGSGPQTSSNRLNRLRDSQADICQALTDAQVDYDLGDEWVMAEFGAVQDGALRVGRRDYEAVILPENMETWLPSTLELVEEFLGAGGTLLALGEPPATVRGRPSDAPAALADKHPDRWVDCEGTDDLLARLRELVPPRVSAPDGSPLPADLSWRREELGDGFTLHFFASPWLQEIDTRVRLDGQNLLALDTMGGDAEPVPTEAHEDGQTADLHLPPGGHALWISAPGPREEILSFDRAPRDTEVTLERVTRLQPNLLVLDYCDLEVQGRLWRNIVTARADAVCGREHGTSRGRRRRAEAPGPEPVDQPRAPDAGFRVEYRFTVEGGDRDSFMLAVERPSLYTVGLNDVELHFPEEGRWFDENIYRTSIAEAVRDGENVLALTAPRFGPRTEIAPVYITGDFALEERERGFATVDSRPLTMGDWREMGLLFYPWWLRYELTFVAEQDACGITVRVPDWKGSALRVHIDGEHTGDAAYPPYEIDAMLRGDGERHTLWVDVAGNMKNMMGPPFNEDLPIGSSWLDGPMHQPPGKRYRFLECGLLGLPEVTLWVG